MKVLAGDAVLPEDVVLTNPLAADSIPAILDRIINFMLIIAAPIAVIMTIYAAYLFITAGDNQEKVKTARKTLMYVIIGVAILILSKGIVSLAKSFLEVPAPAEPAPSGYQIIKEFKNV
jgi:heme/copper-type cytochrome/quinol oxidase subunit 2